MSARMEYLELQQYLDPYFPAGARRYWKALYLDGFSDAAIAQTVDWSTRRPSAETLVIVRHCGGAISRVGAEETAFGDRSSEWMLSIDSTWDDPVDDEANISKASMSTIETLARVAMRHVPGTALTKRVSGRCPRIALTR